MRIVSLHAGIALALALPTLATAQAACARYFPDNDPAVGTSNMIPLGTAAPSALTTVFTSNVNSLGITTIYFDVTASTHLYLQGIELNAEAGSGLFANLDADVYYRSGTHVGFEGSTAGWSPRTAALGLSMSAGSPSRLDFKRGIFCAANVTLGIAVVARNFEHKYSSGTPPHSDSRLTISGGATSLNAFVGPTYAPRTPNVTLRYQVDTSTWHNQRYQTILRSQDLGGAGNITDLALAPLQSGAHYNRELRVRMASRSPGYPLTTNFALNTSGFTEVLHTQYHTWHMHGNEWNEIGLAQPFYYDGVSDVVVEVFARGNHMSIGPLGGFRSSPNQERLFAYGWPLNVPPTTGTYRANHGLKMRVDFSCAEGGEFGTSCGRARADLHFAPVAGGVGRFDIHDGLPFSGAVLVMGLDLAPQDMSSFGYTNCWAWNSSAAAVLAVTGNTGFAPYSLSLPKTTAFDGMNIYGHWANFDPSQPGGVTFTNYVRMIIGQEDPNQ